MHSFTRTASIALLALATTSDVMAMNAGRSIEGDYEAFSLEARQTLVTTFPTPKGVVNLAAAQDVPKMFDGGMKKFDRTTNTCKSQAEGGSKDAVFILAPGATLSNVIIGPNNGEGVHCLGPCTLNNVWWLDVCEDAATFKQASGVSNVNGGGAQGASDKVFQHNGGGTVNVKNFYAKNCGKVYRSCGNCATSAARISTFTNVRVEGSGVIAGVNKSFGDKTTITNSCTVGTKSVCDIYDGVKQGSEPKKLSSGADGSTCTITNVKTSGC